MKHVVKFAGVSIVDNDSIHFHTTGIDGKIGVWFTPPGRATYTFVKLPKTMSKLDAAKYLLRHKQFKNPKIQRFLKLQVERREEGVVVNPRRVLNTKARIRNITRRARQPQHQAAAAA